MPAADAGLPSPPSLLLLDWRLAERGALVLTTDRRLKDAAFELLRADRGLPGSITGATVDVYLSRRRPPP